MEYAVFDQMLDGVFSRKDTEAEQAYMERVLQAAFVPINGERTERINDMLQPRLSSCNANEKTLSLVYHAEDWMCNPNGALHGGLLTTTIDMTMGLLSRYCRQSRKVVTTNLSINFLRGVPNGADFEVRVTADKVGGRMIFLSAHVILCDGGKIAATAQGTFV